MHTLCSVFFLCKKNEVTHTTFQVNFFLLKLSQNICSALQHKPIASFFGTFVFGVTSKIGISSLMSVILFS